MRSQILKFKEMPFDYQRAIVIYGGEDGIVNWTDIGQIDWFNTEQVQIWIDDYIKVYADREFRLGTIRIEEVIDRIMPRVSVDTGFETFEEYHEWAYDGTDHGDSVFPIVISKTLYFDKMEEFIEDGWHRFHSYVHKGIKEIPFVEYFPRG